MKLNKMTLQAKANKDVIRNLSYGLSDKDKLSMIFELSSAISDESIKRVVLESFSMAVDVIEGGVDHSTTDSQDYSIDMTTKISRIAIMLGYSLEEVVGSIIEMSNSANQGSSKAPDKESLDFITSDVDVDDYEKFLEENKVKENLDFLNTQI
jgi:hypothetical protein